METFENSVPQEFKRSRELAYQNIIWAVDAFPENEYLHERAAIALQAMGGEHHILPVYALSPDSMNWNGEFIGDWTARFKPIADDTLKAQLERLNVRGQMKPHVIVQPQASRKATVSRFLHFAEKVKADMIVAGTHSRTGIRRWILGSFAEMLLHQSQIPVLMVNPHNRPVFRFKNVIFGTDFSESCQRQYPKVLKFAQEIGAELHLFNKVPHPIEPLVQSGVYLLGGGWISLDQYMVEETSERNRSAEKWIIEAERWGVTARFVSENLGDSAAEAIVNYARRLDSAVIAMISQTGPVMSALLGSVTREVVRIAPCPVFVVPGFTHH